MELKEFIQNFADQFDDTNANEYGTEIKMTIEKFDVYIGGEYVRTVTARYKNDDKWEIEGIYIALSIHEMTTTISSIFIAKKIK